VRSRQGDSTTVSLSTVGIEKSFGATKALRGIDFTLHRGEVHALLGENGAGKSTFVKILSGAHSPDRGSITIGGRTHARLDPSTANASGISTIYQQSALFPSLSVIENVFAGHMIRNRSGTLNWKKMEEETRRIFRQLNVDLPLRSQLMSLDKATVQLVGIAKALSSEAEIILMDEPTAALSSSEVETLFDIIERLRDAGKAIIYISHYVDEVLRIADRITVFREGQIAGTALKGDADHGWIIQKMIGQKPEKLYNRTYREPGQRLLEVRHLSSPGQFEDVGFSVREGEVVAIVGLYGSGFAAVLSAAFGVDGNVSGEVLIGGERVALKPWNIRDRGVGLIPGDRALQGVFREMSATDNMIVSSTRNVSTCGVLRRDRIRRVASSLFRRLLVSPPNEALEVSAFSGGNQQKIVLGRWIAASPKVLFMNEPTQGVDIGAKTEIYRLIDSLVNDGMGIVLASSDLNEVSGLADRILVTSGGRISAELKRGAGVNEIVHASNGLAVTDGPAHA
jgi:rhamnose transport system ATP-binding protein